MAATSLAWIGDADDKLVGLLKEELDGEEAALFIDGFCANLRHDARKDFVVNLDAVFRPWDCIKRHMPVLRPNGTSCAGLEPTCNAV